MGTVFRAFDESLDRVVAVKFLLPELQQDPAMVERFRREARASATIQHRNVVQIFATGTYGRSDFFVAEYLEGETLDRYISLAGARGEHIPIAEALWILEQTSVGLGAIHAAGVVHRDLKPGNLMVDRDGKRVVIMDFGIGRRFAPGEVRATVAPGGTPAYMAPEVIAGSDQGPDSGVGADIYALGVTAFELLTSSLPFDSPSWVDILHKHLVEDPPRPSTLRPDVPPALDEVVLRCLSKLPEDRYASAEQVRQAILPHLRSWDTTPSAELVVTKRRHRVSTSSPIEAGKTGRATSRRRSRIVVAHSDPAFRALVHAAARVAFEESLAFEAARSSAEALTLAREHPTDVLVAPLSDPLNGLELAAAIRGDPTLHGARLVLVGEAAGERDRALLSGLGVRDIVAPDITAEELAPILSPPGVPAPRG